MVYAQPVPTLARELISLQTGRKARKGGRRRSPAPRIRQPIYIDERPAEVAAVQCRETGKVIWWATRHCVTEWRWKTFAVVLSQQRNEAGGGLI